MVDHFDRRLGEPLLHGYSLAARAFQAYFSDEWREALRYADAAELVFGKECIGAFWEMWTMRYLAAWSTFYLGAWGDQQRRVGAHLDEARDRGNAYAMAGLRTASGVTTWLARGDLEGARRNVRESIASWSVQGLQLQHVWFLFAESLIDLHAGEGQAAWARLGAHWPALARSQLLRFPQIQAQMQHLRAGCALAAAARTADPAEARRLRREARNAIQRLGRVRSSMARPFAGLLRAAEAAQAGRVETAARSLFVASQELERLHMLGYATAARRVLARLTEATPPAWPAEEVADPDGMERMLVPGFPLASSSHPGPARR